jgi:hypothetical protein
MSDFWAVNKAFAVSCEELKVLLSPDLGVIATA